MLHWYASNYNVHKILNNLYEDLSDSFDKLQEEIIGTSTEYNVIFPSFGSTLFQLENIDAYKGDSFSMDYYYQNVNDIKSILTSLEFSNYISNVKSGLANTREDIISTINKANYLLSMVKF
jgi:DNA-binding ferritin-like protein